MDNSNIFDCGRIVKAKYRKTEVAIYDGNPLIEALPSILDAARAGQRISYFSKMDEGSRTAPDHIRYHHIRSYLKFFFPLDIHLDLERRLSSAVRMGYSERNPLKKDHWKQMGNALDSFDQYGDYEDYNSTTAFGFNVIGASGNGKSQSFRRVLGLYPQVIYHREFENFTETQLVWLKLDCPFDGSIKGLCINLFQAIDAILHTNYQENYIKGRSGTDEMISSLARVAANHHLGVLVIDEIQRLSLAKSGGVEKMLNFFVQIVNTIGVPVCLVGTFKAMPLFTGNFSQARRGTGIIWDRMSFDDEWAVFFNSMWKYEITRHITPESKLHRLSEVLYEETQGIIDLAIKAFIFAQERAIDDGSERITPGIIRSVVRDKFKMLLPALEAFRRKDKKAMAKFEDAYSGFVGEYLVNNFNQIPTDELPLLSSTRIVGEITQEPEIKNLLDKSVENINAFFKNSSSNDPLDKTKMETFPNQSQPAKKRRVKKKNVKEKIEGVLPKILKDAQDTETIADPYQLLEETGFIHSGDDLLSSNDDGESISENSDRGDKSK